MVLYRANAYRGTGPLLIFLMRGLKIIYMGCSVPWMLCLINYHLKMLSKYFLMCKIIQRMHERCMNIELILLHSLYNFAINLGYPFCYKQKKWLNLEVSRKMI